MERPGYAAEEGVLSGFIYRLYLTDGHIRQFFSVYSGKISHNCYVYLFYDSNGWTEGRRYVPTRAFQRG